MSFRLLLYPGFILLSMYFMIPGTISFINEIASATVKNQFDYLSMVFISWFILGITISFIVAVYFEAIERFLLIFPTCLLMIAISFLCIKGIGISYLLLYLVVIGLDKMSVIIERDFVKSMPYIEDLK